MRALALAVIETPTKSVTFDVEAFLAVEGVPEKLRDGSVVLHDGKPEWVKSILCLTDGVILQIDAPPADVLAAIQHCYTQAATHLRDQQVALVKRPS